ncbi:MAG: M23 family metallopeptidase [Desulfuromonadaceae bacterium]
MAKTDNAYQYPIDNERIVRIAYNESPAHVGPLAYSVDFIVPEGTEVKAAADGIVIEVKDDSNIGGADKDLEQFGNYIEIEHPHGEYSEYEHLKNKGALVKVGDRITRGQVIGYSGATGWIAHLGPHLHFMVGKYGNVSDEYQTLEIVWAKQS